MLRAVAGGAVTSGGTGVAGVSSFNLRTGAVTLFGSDISNAGGALLLSPVFTGDPRAPTPAPGDADTSIATTAFVTAANAALLASPVFTGDPQAPTPTAGDSDNSIATTSFVTNAINTATSTITVGAVVADVPPALTQGKLWWNSAEGELYVGYQDVNSNQWVEANSGGLNDAPNDGTLYARQSQVWAAAASPASVQAAVAPALNDVGRNFIHNPGFTINQRGNGPFTTAGYSFDRWYANTSTDTVSFARNAAADADRSAVGDESLVYYLTNTFAGSAAAGAFNEITQMIESVRRLSGKTITVSFWASAGVAALRLGCAITQYFGTGGSPSANVNINGQSVALTTSMARYSMTFAVPSTAGKTFGSNGNDYTQIRFCYSSGATNNVFFGSVGVQSGLINLWGVQVETGTIMSPLTKRDPADELAVCQRFYQIGHMQQYFSSAGAISGSVWEYPFPVTMRSITPAMTLSGVSQVGATGLALVPIAGVYGTSGYQFTYNVTGAAGTVVQVLCNWTASADL